MIFHSKNHFKKYHNTHSKTLHVFEYNEQNTYGHALKKTFVNRSSDNSYMWLIKINEPENFGIVLKSLKEFPMKIDDDILLLSLSSTHFGEIWETYKIAPTKDPIVNKIAEWSSSNESTSIRWTKENKWKRRRNLLVFLH